MVRLNKRYSIPVLLYIVILLVFLLPHYQNQGIELFEVMFFNFDIFFKYELSKFNMELLVANFLLFFYFVHTQISDLLENTSFFSMACHKQSKRDLIIIIIKETLYENMKFYLISVLSIFFLSCVVDSLIIHQIAISIRKMVNIMLFLMKYFTLVFMIIVNLKLYALIHAIHHEEVVPYMILIMCLLLDNYFRTYLFSISSDTSINLLYFCIVMIVGSSFMSLIIYKIHGAKELFI